MIHPQSSTVMPTVLPLSQPGGTHHHGLRIREPPRTPEPTALTSNSSAPSTQELGLGRRNRTFPARALEALSPAPRRLTTQACSSISSVSNSYALHTVPSSVPSNCEQKLRRPEKGRPLDLFPDLTVQGLIADTQDPKSVPVLVQLGVFGCPSARWSLKRDSMCSGNH